MSQSKALYSDAQLLAASIFQVRVSVWQHTADDIPVLIQDGGIIEKITPYSVKISGTYYDRDESEFRVSIVETAT